MKHDQHSVTKILTSTFAVALLACGVVILGACDSGKSTSNNNPTSSLGGSSTLPLTPTKTAPDFSLPDLEGNNHNLSEWKGKVMVLNFWATWCPPCRKETPLFVELQEQYGAKGLQFIGVAIDTKDKVQDFMDTFGVNYPMLIGANDAVKISESYGNRLGGLPFTVVIDRNGQINYVRQGEFTRETAEKIIPALL